MLLSLLESSIRTALFTNNTSVFLKHSSFLKLLHFFCPIIFPVVSYNWSCA